MDYTNIIENIIAALISAIVIGFVAWVVSWVRNTLLERKLKNSINPNGAGIQYDQANNRGTFTLQIHNYSNSTIRVRAIVLVADKFRVELKPSPLPVRQTPLSNEIALPKFKRKHLSKGALDPDNNTSAMLLPPKTMGFWEIKSESISSREWIIENIFMVFEYATIFGNSAMVRMEAPESTLKLVKQNFEPLFHAIHNKKPFDVYHGLNKAQVL